MKRSLGLAAALLLASCASTQQIEPQIASASVDFSQATPFEITLSSFDYAPAEIRLAAGRPYRITLVNAASGGHDFTAPEFFAAASVAPDDAALIAAGQVDLKAGEAATFHLVPAAGTFKLVCTHFGHATLGMTGSIVVE